ncbi:MAG: class I SAM-dependent methyltransferase [Candidatus Eisenbacteria bacterium]|nr:class I SAM-dependent methyltransferase [Candidatus Eisenbacteria bacterium]
MSTPTSSAAPRATIERIDPHLIDTTQDGPRTTLDLHLERYEFAARHAAGRRVLDLACGVGYGSALLREKGKAREVLGVDVDDGAIRRARETYAGPGVSFLCRSAYEMSTNEAFDMAVSLETIEHLPDPDRFLTILHGLLSPGALLVGSVPVTPSVDVNIHHLHDFTASSFRRLLTRHGFEPFEEQLQLQPYSLFRLRREIQSNAWGMDIRPNLPGYYLKHPGKAWARFCHMLRDGTVNKYLVVAARRIP